MAWQYPISSTSTSTTIDLGTTDSVYVAEQFGITASGYNSAIKGTGSNHHAIIDGSVAAAYAVWLGDDADADSGQILEVSKTGKLFSGGEWGAIEYGANSSIINEGIIKSGYIGASIFASATTGMSTITNSGTISGDAYAVTFDYSTQEVDIVNTGIITSKGIAIFGGHGADKVINSGSIKGEVDLGEGADLLDTRKGTLSGPIHGDDGADTIYGSKAADTIYGDAGIDKIIGGGGADNLFGGTDADQFVYVGASDSTMTARDTIGDFTHADVIDIQKIDANSQVSGNQAFQFIGTAAFSHTADELRYSKVSGNTYVYGDTNGDGKADFSVKLTGSVTMVNHDFIL